MDGKDQAVLKAIQAGIDKVNKKAESNAKKVQKWSILPRDFSIPGGELGKLIKFLFLHKFAQYRKQCDVIKHVNISVLHAFHTFAFNTFMLFVVFILSCFVGPTLKLKRPVVSKMYQNTISVLYGES